MMQKFYPFSDLCAGGLREVGVTDRTCMYMYTVCLCMCVCVCGEGGLCVEVLSSSPASHCHPSHPLTLQHVPTKIEKHVLITQHSYLLYFTYMYMML